MAAQLDSNDPAARANAQAELSALCGQIDREPTPTRRFGLRIAQALRETAERLDRPAQ